MHILTNQKTIDDRIFVCIFLTNQKTIDDRIFVCIFLTNQKTIDDRIFVYVLYIDRFIDCRIFCAHIFG